VVNALSVDIEDYFHAEALAAAAPRESWDQLESRVDRNTKRVLELFSRAGVQGTFFVLGWVAERHPGLVREIRSAGHEVACHSYWHRLIYRLTPEEFREDTRKAKSVIEDAIGEPIHGYRAPSFSIVQRSFWALEILAELGFRYDSSVFPIHHDLYGVPGFSRVPCVHTCANGARILEFPLSTFRMGSLNFPVGGGGYLRIFPSFFTQYGFERLNRREQIPVMVYFHPWEVDPGQPRMNVKAKSRFRHYTNLGSMERRIAGLIGRYSFAPIVKLPQYETLISEIGHP